MIMYEYNDGSCDQSNSIPSSMIVYSSSDDSINFECGYSSCDYAIFRVYGASDCNDTSPTDAVYIDDAYIINKCYSFSSYSEMYDCNSKSTVIDFTKYSSSTNCDGDSYDGVLLPLYIGCDVEVWTRKTCTLFYFVTLYLPVSIPMSILQLLFVFVMQREFDCVIICVHSRCL